MQRARQHRGHRDLAPDDAVGEEVVVARAVAEGIEVDMAGLVAREAVAAAFVEQRAEAKFEVGSGLEGCLESVHDPWINPGQ